MDTERHGVDGKAKDAAVAPHGDVLPAKARLRTVLGVAGVAVAAALLHLLPYAHAHFATPSGWSFTWNIHRSPDIMQYRAWFRHSADGVIVANRLTPEANDPHLPIPFQWFVGSVGRRLGWAPEAVYCGLGALLALLVVPLLWRLTTLCLTDVGGRRWAFAACVFGGGAGGWFQFAARRRLLPDVILGAENFSVFDGNYRGHYTVSALFDTHVLFIWLILLLVMTGLVAFMRKPGVAGALVTVVAGGLLPFFHVYAGMTLLAFLAGVGFVLGRRGMLNGARSVLLASVALAVVAGLAFWWQLYRRSGLDVPAWAEPGIPVTVVLLAYPVAALTLPWLLPRLWKSLDATSAVTAGWALGGLVMLLAWPFYPYPSRGAYTLFVPLILLTTWCWRSAGRPLGFAAVGLATLLSAGTPLFEVRHWWRTSAFSSTRPETFLDDDARRLTAEVEAAPHAGAILLMPPADVNWLGPYWSGRLWLGHWFLTQDWPRRTAAFDRFLAASADERRTFLIENDIGWLYLPAAPAAAISADLAELEVWLATPRGTMFRLRRP